MRRLPKDDQGPDLIEYALVVGLLCIGILAGGATASVTSLIGEVSGKISFALAK